MPRDEVARLVADISLAIQSSDLLSLLRKDPESQSPSLSSHEQQQQYHIHDEGEKRSLLKQQNRKSDKHPPLPKCLSEIPRSILDDRVKPIRAALERIDAQKLLNLEILQEQQQHHPHPSQERAVKGPRVRDGVYCRPICDQIRPKLCIDEDVAMEEEEEDDDDTNHNRKSSVVRYLHIAEVPEEYTIGIFVFGPHENIPLHDHPEMCVLSRVLYGDLQRLSLDLDRSGRDPNDSAFRMDTADDDEMSEASSSLRHLLEKPNAPPETSNGGSSSLSAASWLSRSATWIRTSGTNIINHNLYNSSSGSCTMDDESDHHQHPYHSNHHTSHHSRREERFPEGTKIAYQNAADVLKAPDVASLYPYEGNLHQFVAGPYGAAVLDVLLPPYDDERKRDCTFYTIREITAKTTTRSPPGTGSMTTMTSITTSTTSTRTAALSRWNNCSQHPPQKAPHSIPPLLSSLSPAFPLRDDTGSRMTERDHQELCLIIPTGQPENFHCISGTYKDLGETDDDYYEHQFDDDDDD